MRIDRRSVMGGGLALAAAGVPLGRAIAADGDVVINHIALEDGRVWIAAKIEGKGPYFFIVDTGGTFSFIEDSFAKSLGLQKVNGKQMAGVGGKVADYSAYVAREVTLASGTRFPDMLFTGIGKRLSKDAVGAFGAGLFTTYDSDLDFVKGEWRAYPKGRPNFDGLTRLPGRFTKEEGGQAPRIQIEATIDGYSGAFLADTGAPGISLNGRAAAKSGLWDDSKPFAPTRIGGIGDASIPGRIVRASKVQVGPFVFEGMLITLSKPGTVSADQEGLLGLSALSLLDLTTDVSGAGSLWGKPNGLKPRRGGYPLSGIWIDENKGRLVVGAVGTGSPAVAAGLKQGDVLVGGNLEAMLGAINGPPGKQVALTVESSGARREVRYMLRPWL
ncbi:aspartyl protease family protein [Sphingomonas sp. JC676]|uniref:aspartyl protease family protein n=1 Tax=Sphingomonas sp. JC676 TaxID=2768065 RepID=UPI0016578405|nr:aspartyl protease family protein [Sphingomonas sp. JC676]MBC9031687.1 aspartyl protease family protein [Sphingomonas sp. JC676]